MEELLRPTVPQYADMGRFNGASVSIVIPCYERSAKLERTLWSIRQTVDIPGKLIVAEAKQCVAKNRNAGLALAETDLIVMMDDDVILPPFWASKLCGVLASDESFGAVSAKMTGMAGEQQNDLGRIPEDSIKNCTPPGTCFVYSKERVGDAEFDEEYVSSQWEDTDFMAQLQDKGLKTLAFGGVWILHDNNWTGHTDSTWAQNHKRFFEKWPGWRAVSA